MAYKYDKLTPEEEAQADLNIIAKQRNALLEYGKINFEIYQKLWANSKEMTNLNNQIYRQREDMAELRYEITKLRIKLREARIKIKEAAIAKISKPKNKNKK